MRGNEPEGMETAQESFGQRMAKFRGKGRKGKRHGKRKGRRKGGR